MNAKTLPIVDAHHHLWDTGAIEYQALAPEADRFLEARGGLPPRYLPADHALASRPIALVGAVHMEAGPARGWEARETEWVAHRTRHGALPYAMVGYADLIAPGLEAMLDRQSEVPGFRGVRQIVNFLPGEPRPGWFDVPAFRSGLRILARRKLSFDLLVSFDQLEAAARVIDQAAPGLQVIVGHCGVPWDLSPDGLSVWRAGLKAVARLPASTIKLTGLAQILGPWSAASARPVLDGLLETFGPRRIMFGSNLPVDNLILRGGTLWSRHLQLTADLSDDERRWIYADTARSAYRLGEACATSRGSVVSAEDAA